MDLAKQQGKQIAVETGVESGLACVSADGRYVVTCIGGDSPSGIVKVYKTADGVKAFEQPYKMKAACNPYQIIMRGESAYAILATESGRLLSPAVALP